MIKCLSVALVVVFSASLAGAEEVYNEVYRPQFHFSPKKNWTNEALLDVPREITASMTEFTKNPAPIEARRAELARAIEELQ